MANAGLKGFSSVLLHNCQSRANLSRSAALSQHRKCVLLPLQDCSIYICTCKFKVALQVFWLLAWSRKAVNSAAKTSGNLLEVIRTPGEADVDSVSGSFMA